MFSLVAQARQFIRPTGTPTEIVKASLLRRRRLLRLAALYLPYFRIGLVSVGFLYLLALPLGLLGREHYVSENALQPAQVSLRRRHPDERTLTSKRDRSIHTGTGQTCTLPINMRIKSEAGSRAIYPVKRTSRRSSAPPV